MVIFHNKLKKALLRVKPPLGIHGGALYARIEIDKLTLGRRPEKANHMVVPDHKVTRGFTKSLEAESLSLDFGSPHSQQKRSGEGSGH